MIVGSSPLTRGKRGGGCLADVGDRLIPAHAGKTKGKAIVSFDPGAHPRSRGENLLCEPAAPELVGSSPLTRGKRARGADHAERGRLIPAHAGKTFRRAGRCSSRRAHPRSRGENNFEINPGWQALGSSPLTRGKRSGEWNHLSASRLIPAHAGKTAPMVESVSRSAAHPRSRGENVKRAADLLEAKGSSPLTRGKLRVGQ